MKLQVYVMF